MLTHVSKIDKHGRIELPDELLEACGLLPEAEVLIELKDGGIYIKPKLTATPVTQSISNMDLPVSDWETMEKEIEEGRLK